MEPKYLEHMLGRVLYFSGECYHSHRILRAVNIGSVPRMKWGFLKCVREVY